MILPKHFWPTLLVLGVIAIFGYSYALRPLAAPSKESAVESSTEVNTFQIDPAASSASFTVGEILRGKPFTVVGTTSDVSGGVKLDPKNLASASIGEIRINARTLKTDAAGRNSAIGRFILQSEKPENEFIVFKEKSVVGLPKTATIGDELAFDVIGDLTVKGTTKEVSFRVTSKLADADTLTGHGEAKILYKDFNLTIPSVPFVASVEEFMMLSIDFTARHAK